MELIVKGTDPFSLELIVKGTDPFSYVGFYYLRARYYNPSIGRFQNMDTFPGMQFEPKSLHKYLYTHANPINGIDPSGNVTLMGIMRGIAGLARLATQAVATYSRIYIKRAITYTIATAAAALRSVKICMRNPKKCPLSVPFITTGGDLPETSQHIYDAQRNNASGLIASPFFLNYSKGKGKRKWYNSSTTCSNGTRSIFASSNGNNGECDEFPYYKSKQGGPNNHPGRVSLRLINQGEGSSQGGKYNAFLNRCKLKNNISKRNSFLAVGLPSFPFSIDSGMLGLCPVKR